MQLRRFLSLFAAPFVLVASLTAQGVSGLVAFGDSLSDNGNLFAAVGQPGFPYWRGRFSNGPVWVERMAPQLGIASPLIQDFAVGGATSDDVLNLQVLPYLASVSNVPDDTLITVWAGSNDLLNLLADPTQDATEVITNAVSNIATSLTLLLMAGADDVVVINLPDLGLVPSVTSLGDPTAVAAANAISVAFNDALAVTLLQLESAFQVDLVEIDSFQILGDVVSDPSSFGFTNAVDAALDQNTGAVDPSEATFLFWDGVHPTTRAHRVIAGLVLEELGAL